MSLKFQLLATAFLIVLTVSSSSSHNCNSIVVKESEGLLNYLANVTFTVPKAVDGDWMLEMETDVPFTFIGGWGVWINSDADAGRVTFKSRLENNTLAAGDEVSFRFRIQWFTGEPRPEVISLKWEGQHQLCTQTDETVEEIKARRKRTSANPVGIFRRTRSRVNYRKRYYINL